MDRESRLLPSLVDEIALSDPHRILYSVAKTQRPADGFEDVQAVTFARAVDRCSWYIENRLGRGQAFPTLTYMGLQDIIYAILVLACAKTGYKLLLNSPRNTLEAHLSLFEKTDCNTFLLPPNFHLPVVQQILAARQMQTLEIPGLKYWTEDGASEPYPYNKTFADGRYEPLVVMHTSGSTNLPKPVVHPHGVYAIVDAFASLSSQGQDPCYPAPCAGQRLYLGFPLFHTAGLMMLLPSPIYSGYTVVLGPFPPSADVVNGVHVHGNVQQSCLPPAVLADLVKQPEHLDNLGQLEQIGYGGGPLPRAVGDLIITKTRLVNCVGTTECGVFPNQHCDPEDWAYLKLSPVLGHEYRHFSGDLYEQVIVRDPKLHRYQGVFVTFPELDEWPVKDLYSKHPTKKDIWLYRGRADDIIVYSTGEKFNPLEMEGIVSADQAVKAALINGLGRFQSSLLVEAVQPPRTEAQKEELLDAIWPSVQAANEKSPSHARIHRNMILFTTEDKPMHRAGKGTVQRKMTLDDYIDEFDFLYKENERSGQGLDSGVVKSAANGHGSVQDMVKHIITTSTDMDVDKVDLTANLFELGLDSLQVTVMTRSLNQQLSESGRQQRLEVRTIYAHPSIAALTNMVSALLDGESPNQEVENDEDGMQRLHDLHTANLPLSARQAKPKPEDGHVVLLTGSTGSLGSYTLDSLVRSARVSRVYCLNRGHGSLERQRKSQAAKGLQPLGDKVRCLDVDMSKPYFGLPTHEYMKLLREVTTVIHNAWRVDFNLSIESFESHISTVRSLIDFSAHSAHGAHIFFISSLSAVSNWHSAAGQTGSVPERIYEDWRTPEAIGYGKSKLVAERLLDTAAREARIPATVCRVGQVAGPTTTTGVWPKQEWLPSLVASSKYMGKLPSSLGQIGMVDWVPVEVAGQSIAELAIHSTTRHTGTGAAVYHVVNPRKSEWEQLVPGIARGLDLERGSEVVSLEAWVAALRESAPVTRDVARNPAIKLLDFFEGLVVEENTKPVVLDNRQAVDVSQALAGLGPVGDEWMENWMRQWGF